MRIAIFGFGDCTGSYKPEEWDEVWRLAHDPLAPQATRVFEAHSAPIARKYGGDAYIARLEQFSADGVLTTLWPYPFGTKQDRSEHKPQSSVAFMMTCIEWSVGEPPTVGIFGVHMDADSEYGYQRPDMMYLIGWARAAGVKVHIDPASSLLKSQWTAGIYGHPDNINDMDYRLMPRVRAEADG